MTITIDISAPTPLVESVNAAFDRARTRLGISNDRDFADRLGVSQKTISFWRNGRWTDADRVLIGILVEPIRQHEAS